MANGPMLNAYPDSIGGTLKGSVQVLMKDQMKDAFESFYILPSIFNTDLDRGFSVIDYNINEELGSIEDVEDLKKLGMNLKLDFILNHASVLSEQFQDVVKNGEQSKYKDFFINWNKFWDGYGTMTETGYIQPDEQYIKNMFFRKPGLPILMVRFPDGRDVPYWNTFYQEVQYKNVDTQDIMSATKIQYLASENLATIVNTALAEGKTPCEIDFGKYEAYKADIVNYMEANRRYLGQMDLNIKSPLVWEYYENTLKQLAEYGASIVRLDAFAYAPKECGEKNFLNDPGTWELLEKVSTLASKFNLALLPEIHASYGEKMYEVVSKKGYMTYDFFLPGLMIYAIEKNNGGVLVRWAKEQVDNNIQTVNMLGCHDGIPLLDLKGFLPDEDIEELISLLVERGGYVKNLHGQKNLYYQVNATYFSALGEDEKKLLFARAVQMFMPGKPQIWYLDLFAGKNDYEAVIRAGDNGHKEINRTNLSTEDITEGLTKQVVKEQIELLKLRNLHPAFGFDSKLTLDCDGKVVTFTWEKNGKHVSLKANFETYDFEICE